MIELIKAKLLEDSYTGLYYPGECACSTDDLAPCGSCEQEEGEEYINDCSPGYKFVCESDPEVWIVKSTNTAPTPEEWEQIKRDYCF